MSVCAAQQMHRNEKTEKNHRKIKKSKRKKFTSKGHTVVYEYWASQSTSGSFQFIEIFRNFLLRGIFSLFFCFSMQFVQNERSNQHIRRSKWPWNCRKNEKSLKRWPKSNFPHFKRFLKKKFFLGQKKMFSERLLKVIFSHFWATFREFLFLAKKKFFSVKGETKG